MTSALVEQVANAVLYEGYILYPYRASSVKNRQRWTFGGLYPRAYSEAQAGSDAWSMQTECLVIGDDAATLDVTVRFLQLLAREVGEPIEPLRELPEDGEPALRLVETLEVGGRVVRAWQEATERVVEAGTLRLGDLLGQARGVQFAFESRRELEPMRGTDGAILGIIRRSRQAIEGAVELATERVGDRLYKLTVRIRNLTSFEPAGHDDRDAALMRSLVSTHTILGVRGGELVSLLDPGEHRDAAAGCENVGTWPVLVGEEGERDTMLSSPIILYDYPQIAPESPGDLFDGTEIDEILTLRILAMTDEEKREMVQIDERARALLERTEALTAEDMIGLHGAVRSLRPLRGAR